jgi:SMC interacting uncharacterized protein involved in chromosome segregation
MSKTTPESKEFQTESKDIYALYTHNVGRFFDEVEKSIPQYHQSITNLQRAYTEAWRNVIGSAISIQREIATKAGTNLSFPPSVAKVVNDVSEEMIKAQTLQNKAVLAAIDATQQSFYDNAKAFTGLNQSAIHHWISASTPTRN